MYVLHLSASYQSINSTHTTAICKGMDSYIEPHKWSLNWSDTFEKAGIRTCLWIVPGTEEEEG